MVHLSWMDFLFGIGPSVHGIPRMVGGIRSLGGIVGDEVSWCIGGYLCRGWEVVGSFWCRAGWCLGSRVVRLGAAIFGVLASRCLGSKLGL